MPDFNSISKIIGKELSVILIKYNEKSDQQRIFKIFKAEKNTANVVSKWLQQSSWYQALIDLKEAHRVQDKIKTSQWTSVTVENGTWATVSFFYTTDSKRFF